MQLSSYIDYTILTPTVLLADVERMCAEAKEHYFATVCVPPLFVKNAKQLTAGSNINCATVIGFPFGYSAVEAKIAEIILAIIDSVDELDIVVNISAIKNNDWQYLANEINNIAPIVKSKSKLLNVIIETGLLTEDEIIKCCSIYGAAGVDCIQTTTGYTENGTSIQVVELLRKYLSSQIQIKAGGAIKSYTFAKQLIAAGATRIECSSLSILNDRVEME